MHTGWPTRSASARAGWPSSPPRRRGSTRGFARPARYDLLVTLDRLGLAEVTATALHADDSDDASLSARRVFGIADRFLLERRAGDLAEACDVPLEALDLALANFER